MLGSGVVSAIISGNLITKTGKYTIWPVLGTGAFALGTGLLGLVQPNSSYAELFWFMFLVGCGLGCVNSPLNIVAQNAVPVPNMAVATVFVTSLRTLGGAIGVAIFGAVLTSELSTNLSPQLYQHLSDASNAQASFANDTASLNQFVSGYNTSIATMFVYCMVPMAFAFVQGFFLENIPLRSKGAEAARTGGADAKPANPAAPAATETAPSNSAVQITLVAVQPAAASPTDPEEARVVRWHGDSPESLKS